MKARQYLTLSLLLATGLCTTASLFCADPAGLKIPNRKERERLEREYKDIHAKKNPTLEELETKTLHAQTLRQTHEQLSQMPHDQHKDERPEYIRRWTDNEKNARYELLTRKIDLLKQEGVNVARKLDDKTISDEYRAECLKENRAIIHNLKLLTQARLQLHPSNVEDKKRAEDLMQQSMVYGLYEQLLAQKSAPATPNAAAPVALQQTTTMTTHTQTTTTTTSNTVSAPATPNAADPDTTKQKDAEQTSDNTTQKTGKSGLLDTCFIQ